MTDEQKQKQIDKLCDKEKTTPEEEKQLIKLLNEKLDNNTITESEHNILYIAMVLHGDISLDEFHGRLGKTKRKATAL